MLEFPSREFVRDLVENWLERVGVPPSLPITDERSCLYRMLAVLHFAGIFVGTELGIKKKDYQKQ